MRLRWLRCWRERSRLLNIEQKNQPPEVAGGRWRQDNDRPQHETKPAVGQERLVRHNGRVECQAGLIVMALSGKGQLIALVDPH
jgi:hypothetical protein